MYDIDLSLILRSRKPQLTYESGQLLLLRRAPGTSGGAVYLAGSLKLIGSYFDHNIAGRDGVAISTSCASSLVELEGIDFFYNGMLCPLGQYDPLKYTQVRNTYILKLH